MGVYLSLRYAAAIAALGTISPSPAADRPDISTGNGLLYACANTNSNEFIRTAEEGRCYAYIQGVVGGLTFEATLSKQPQQVCVPDGVTLGQLRDIVVRHLQAHPEVRHLYAAGFVWQSLSEAYACPAR